MRQIDCKRCGTCCKEPLIPINDLEVRKLVKATGMPGKKIVRFYSIDEIQWDQDADDWVELAVGHRIMAIRKVRDRCVFLTRNGCSVYNHRPRVCRIFPVDFLFEEDSMKMDVERQSRVKGCKAVTPDSSENNMQLVSIGRALYKSDLTYQKKVAKWNRQNYRGTISQYLEYLKIDSD